MNENKISLFTAVLMNINLMVGAGIYIGAMLMASKAGTTSFLGWPLASLVFLPVVWSIGQVAKLFPGRGSFYSYAEHGLGELAGFVSGWLYFLGYVSIGALQILGLRDLLHHHLGFTWIGEHPVLFTLVFLTTVGILNMFALNIVARILSSATLFKLIPLFLVLLISWCYYDPSTPLITSEGLRGLGLTLPIARFGFWGFESCCNISHLIAGDKRNAYRAVLIGFFATVAIYTLFHLGLIYIMGADRLATEGVAAFVHYLYLPSALGTRLISMLITASIIVAYISAIYGAYLANSALVHAMALENKIFFARFLRITNNRQRPVAAIALHGALMFTFVTCINLKDALNATSNLGVLGAFLFTLASLLILQCQKRSYFNAGVTVLGLMSSLLLCSFSWELSGMDTMSRLMNSMPLVVAVGLGVLGYLARPLRRPS